MYKTPNEIKVESMDGITKTVIDVEESDPVNHPDHYNDRMYKGEKIEAIDLIEIFIQNEKNPKVAYNMSNILKYLLRFRTKDKPIQDVKKGEWYFKRMLLKLYEEENE